MARHSPRPYWSYEETKERLNGIDNVSVREYAQISYMLGGRLNEIRDIRPKDIQLETIGGENYLLVSLHTLKNKAKWKTRVIPIKRSTEPHYFQILLTFAGSNLPESEPFKRLSARRWQQLTRRYLDVHPHDFRHLRAHHLGKVKIPGQKQFNTQELMHYFGWTSLATAVYYLEGATTEEVIKKM